MTELLYKETIMLDYLKDVSAILTINNIGMADLHAHREYLLANSKPVSITTHMRDTHRGNISGILRELVVPRQYWEVIIYLNDLDASVRFNAPVLFIPEYQLLSDLTTNSSNIPVSTSPF